MQENATPTDEARLYNEKLAALRAQQRILAAKHEPACPVCNGATWVLDAEAVTLDHPRFGKPQPCPACSVPQRQRDYLRDVCNLTAQERGYTLADWWATTPERSEAARLVSETLRHGSGWLTICGGFGSGKSYLACAIVNAAIAQKREARYWIMASLLDHLRDAYDPQKDIGYSNLLHDLVECPLLVVDECHVFNSTPWAGEKFRQLMSERYRRNLDCLTVLVTNVNPLTQRPPPSLGFLWSRMSEFPVIEITGDVRRALPGNPAPAPAPAAGSNGAGGQVTDTEGT